MVGEGRSVATTAASRFFLVDHHRPRLYAVVPVAVPSRRLALLTPAVEVLVLLAPAQLEAPRLSLAIEG